MNQRRQWLNAAAATLPGIAVVVVIWRHLPLPLTGDQSLFLYGAEQLADGAVLYRDFWDIKAPGVYLFYLTAGFTMGFTPVGMHVLEAVWLGITAWLLHASCRTATQGSRLVHLLPLTTVGAYYLAVTPWHLTQPDGLLVLPLALVCWALVADRERHAGPAAWALAGFTTALAMLFVTAAVFIALLFVATSWAFNRYCGSPTSRPDLVRAAIAYGVGLIVPLVALFAWYAARDALPDLLWTLFRYPVEAQVEFDRKVDKLISSVRWFFHESRTLLPASAVGLFVTVAQARRRQSSALVGLLMVAWLAGGAATLLMQYHYSWEFHLQHLFIPVGVLAVVGLSESWRQLRSGAAPAVCAALILVTAAFPVLLLKKPVDLAGPTSTADRFRQSAQTGLAGANPGESVYVFGDPRILLATGRAQAVAENGWALEAMLKSHWLRFSASMYARKPIYLYLGKDYPELLGQKAPDLLAWIRSEYAEVASDTFGGRWLRLRE